MPPTVTVSNEDIVAAFGTSERFPTGSPQFEVFAPFIGHLAQIVGKDRLDETVEFGNLCDVTGQLLSWLAVNDEFLGKLDVDEADLVRVLYSNLAGQLKVLSDDPKSVLKSLSLSSEAALMSDDLGLNEAAKELVRHGELTFAKLLTTSPACFIPRS